MKVHLPVPSEREQDRFELSGALHGERFVEALVRHDVQSVSAPLDAHCAHVPVPVGERCLWSRQSLHVRMMHGSHLAKTRKRHADRHY
jgi:hypothetical protein